MFENYSKLHCSFVMPSGCGCFMCSLQMICHVIIIYALELWSSLIKITFNLQVTISFLKENELKKVGAPI